MGLLGEEGNYEHEAASPIHVCVSGGCEFVANAMGLARTRRRPRHGNRPAGSCCAARRRHHQGRRYQRGDPRDHQQRGFLLGSRVGTRKLCCRCSGIRLCACGREECEPGFSDMDAALSKDFRVSEAKYFQLRVESYNALNHQSLGLPNTNWCLPPNADGSVDAVHQAGCQFGWISGVQRDPRAFEFSLKFVF